MGRHVSGVTGPWEDARVSLGIGLSLKGIRPPQSPDLTPPVFFLWDLLMGGVFKHKPGTANDLKRKFSKAIAAILPPMLSETTANKELHV
jgi:hypothetical protein